jgi:hypothetical protein
MPENERRPFPFVVGCGRSGTTLVRAMLDAHHDVAVPFESYFPVWFARRSSKYERPDGFDVARFVDDLNAHDSFRRWELDADDVRKGMTQSDPKTYPDAVRAAFALYASARGKPRYADKTPVFVTYIPLLADLFPEAVFVHLIRDGRDVVLSRTEASWGTRDLEHETLLWRGQVEQGRADGSKLGPGRYREIHYEHLLDDSEDVARRLCELAGLDFDPAMLTYHERAASVLRDQPFPEEHQNLLLPPTKGLRDWRTEMDADQIALFDCLAGSTLERFGYERTTSTPSAGLRARALLARTRYESTEQYRRLRSRAWYALHPNVGK